MLSAILLGVFMLSVSMLSAIMLSVVAPVNRTLNLRRSSASTDFDLKGVVISLTLQ
jgi:hypothetical protein